MKISLEQLSVTLGGQTILNGIELELPANKTVGIIGPNGSGKSSLLQCIYRALRPTTGAVFLDGIALEQYSMRQSAQKMAVVAQHNYYNFDFTVQDVVLMGRSPHKRLLERDNADDYKIVEKSLAVVGMSGFEHRIFSTLSGGEQQRVILARALAQQTPCLILDEPTNHLDIKYQLQLMDIVCGLGCTVITAIHDLNIAALYCNQLIAMQNGSIVGIGSPKELLTEEFIQTVYGVQANVMIDDTGIPRIFYKASSSNKR